MNENAISKAEKDIATILQQLEKETESVVSYVELNDVDVTTMTSRRTELERHVRVEMKRLPGTKWGQTK